MRVSVPVADLRKNKTVPERRYHQDLDQETQLLFNERVVVHKEEGEWAWVEAVDQQKFNPEEGWKGYQGWMKRDQLIPCEHGENGNVVVTAMWTVLSFNEKEFVSVCFGTRFNLVDESDGKANIRLPNGKTGWLSKKHLAENVKVSKAAALDYAKKFIGSPYHWGGCSAYSKECSTQTSVDCSGLVHLAYRAAGVDLPRDAKDQYKVVTPVEFSGLVPGDLIFAAKTHDPQSIDHVMFYAGHGDIVEATMTHQIVQQVSFEEKYGIPLERAAEGNVNFFFGKIL